MVMYAILFPWVLLIVWALVLFWIEYPDRLLLLR